MEESLDQAAAHVLATKVGLPTFFSNSSIHLATPTATPAPASLPSPITPWSMPASSLVSRRGVKQCPHSSSTLEVPWQGEIGGRSGVQDDEVARSPRLRPCRHPRSRRPAHPRQARLRPHRLRAPAAQFTLRQLQEIHETILGRTLNKDSFRRRLLASGLIVPTGKLEQTSATGPRSCIASKVHSRQKRQ